MSPCRFAIEHLCYDSTLLDATMLFRLCTLAVLLLATSPCSEACQIELVKLVPNDGDGEDLFGFSVAISGNTIVVGAPGGDDNGSLSGSAYAFDTETESQIAKLLPDNGASGDLFGFCVAVDGNTVVVGAPFTGASSGSVYVFDASSGLQVLELVRDDPASLDEFGTSVAISGDMVIVGSPGDALSRGSAYLFNARTGAQVAKLLADDGSTGDHFGSAVGISGPSAVVSSLDGGNPGAAYLFNTATFMQTSKLLTLDGLYGDEYGASVAIDYPVAIVGSRLQEGTGTAYLFDASGAETRKLLAGDGDSPDGFGVSSDVSLPFVIVGTSDDDNASGTNAGAAYVFDAVTGVEVAKLTSSDGAAGDIFGLSVALDGVTAVVGAPNDDDNGSNSGAAYVYRVSNGFCFGASCPCGNHDPGGGCRNSTGRGGRLLAPFGASVSADDLVLTATHMPPGNLGLFVAAGSSLEASALVGDGLLCIGGDNVYRFAPAMVAPDGTLRLSSLGSLVPPGYLVPGDDRMFQAWSRDVFCAPVPVPCPSPCGGGSNLTNAVEVRFLP